MWEGFSESEHFLQEVAMSRLSSVITALVIAVMLLAEIPAQAEQRPIQLSLVTPIQIHPEEYTISGFRFNLLYGRNASVVGFDWGLVNQTTTGLSQGLQMGLVSLADADFTGLQYSSVNVTGGTAKGMQWGIVNTAGFANGLQFGLVNYAKSMKGLQIGLVNIIKQGGQFPVFPIVNWSF
jgi:hypothetical protein